MGKKNKMEETLQERRIISEFSCENMFLKKKNGYDEK